MDDSHKKQFWLMLNVTMELTNKPPLTKEAIITWWHLLAQYDYDVVEKAINRWVDNSSKPPTPHDIKELCAHKVTIFAKIPSPLAKESNKIHSSEMVKKVHEAFKPPKDGREWARAILADQKGRPEISIRYAKEALGLT